MRFETNWRAAVTAKSFTQANENFHAYTEPMDTTRISSVRLGVEIAAIADVELRFGVQFSPDKVNWGTAEGFDVNATDAYVSALGWSLGDSYEALAGFTAQQGLYVRFGLMVKNATGSEPECVTARLRVEIPDQPGRTYVGGPLLCASDGTTSETFTPLGVQLDSESVGSYRVTWAQEANSGLAKVRAGYQLSDDDGVTWGTATAIGTATGTNGITWGHDFSTLTGVGDNQLIRFGALVSNDAASSKIEAVTVSQRAAGGLRAAGLQPSSCGLPAPMDGR